MSTRSMTLIKRHDGKCVPLYRHWDGYPAEAGAAIVEALRLNPPHAEDVLVSLLSLRDDGPMGDPRPTYEAATWQPEEQGDLEHVYVISRDTTAPDSKRWTWLVTHYERVDWSDKDWREWKTAGPMTLDDFVRVVNWDRQAINQRLHERRPGATGYDMIEPCETPLQVVPDATPGEAGTS